MSNRTNLAGWMELAAALAVGATAIVAVAAIAAALVRSAAWRRTVWQMATIGLAILLGAEFTGVARGVVQWSAASVYWPTFSFSNDANTGAVYGDHFAEQVDGNSVAGSETVSGDLRDFRERVAERPIPAVERRTSKTALNALATWFAGDRAASGFGWLWLIGFAAVLAKVLAGRAVLAVFRRRQRSAAGELAQLAETLAARLRIRRRVRVLSSEALAGPIAFGIWRPTVCLPARFAERFDRSQQQAMLAHELAHLAAHDPAWHLIADFVAAALWWHPLAWWSRHELRAASELAADEASLVVRDGPTALAACLVELGAELVRRPAAAGVSIAGTGFRSSLGRRVERLLRLPTRRWRPPSRAGSLIAKILGPAAMVAAALVSTGWSRPADFSKGATMLDSIRSSWRQSFAAVALTGVLSFSPAAEAAPPAGDPTVAAAAALQKDGDGEKKSQDDRDAAVAKLKDRLTAIDREVRELQAAGKGDAAEKLAAEARELKAHLDKLRGDTGEKKPVGDTGEKKPEALRDKDDKKPESRRDKGDKKPDASADKKPDPKVEYIKYPAGPTDELRERLKKLEEENAKLREQLGDKGDKGSRDLKKTSVEFDLKSKKTDATQANEKLKALEQEIAELLKAGKKEEAEKLRRAVEDGQKKTPDKSDVKKEAAEYYKKLVDKEGKSLPPQTASGSPELAVMLKELREEVSRLRNEVAELRKMVKGDNSPKK